MNITIRRAVSTDIPNIIRLLEYTCNFHAKGRPDIFKAGGKKYDSKALLAILNDKLRVIFAAITEDSYLAGFCLCEWQAFSMPFINEHTSLYIDDICVDETYRRQGIGKKLFAAAVEFAKESEVYAIDLNVWEFNESAIKFYESLGFTTRFRKMELIL